MSQFLVAGIPLESPYHPLPVIEGYVGYTLPLVLAERHYLYRGVFAVIDQRRVLTGVLPDVVNGYARQEATARTEHSPHLALFKHDVLNTPEAAHVAAQVAYKAVRLFGVYSCASPDDLIIQGYRGCAYAEHDTINARIVETC